MKAIFKLSKKYGFKIIEDASHAIGGEYLENKVGNCLYSDITIFSFHPVKIITSAEGGMALTNDEKLKVRMDLLRSHGVTRNEDLMAGTSHGPWYYQQISLGFNYRMSDLHAALGLSQMSRLDEFIFDRNRLADIYLSEFKESKIILPSVKDSVKSSWHLFIIQVDKSIRKNVFESLRGCEIGVNVHYMPIYKQPYYSDKYPDIKCINAEKYYEQCISIPLYHGLSESDQQHVIESVNRFTA